MALGTASFVILLFIVLAAQFWIATALNYPCANTFSSLTFCNTSLPIKDRVDDLVGRLSLHEKVHQLVNTARGVPRLGIPPYEWWSEALHGVSNTGPGTEFGGSIPGAVSFPQVILTAASFNESLWRRIGEVISTEARAMYNMGQSGLTFWSPNVNIFRDPRWGRGQETPGEDPLVASMYAANFVQGLQSIEDGDPEKSLKVGACCKHFSAYDVDQWNGIDRYHFDAKVTEQDMLDTYQPPFQTCVEKGEVACVMCSYNRINGVPACADKNLLSETVRNQWKLNGYIASDCDSIQVMFENGHFTRGPEGSVAASIRAGLNLNCGTYLSNYTERAVVAGLLREEEVDESLSYLYTSLMRLGYFNGNPRKQKWGSLGPDQVCTDEHRELAVEAAKQGIVLLKNERNALPLSKNLEKVAVIGPNADATDMLIGNYAGMPCRNTTALRGLERYVDVEYEQGCGGGVVCNKTTGRQVAKAVQAATSTDAVILVMGLDQTQEREGFDRTSLHLPPHQRRLILAVANAARGPVILVIMSGGPVDLSFAQSNPHIHAIVWAGYPGEGGGDALASIIFGDSNPSGRLPNTWYHNSYTKWPMTNMQMRPNHETGYPGRTYRFHNDNKSVLYPFGYGLSYTNFSVKLFTAASVADQASTTLHLTHHNTTNNPCAALSLPTPCGVVDAANVQNCPSINVDVKVHNEGSLGGDYVSLLMWEPSLATQELYQLLGAPVRQLVGFKRLQVPGNQSTNTTFTLSACEHLSFLAPNGKTRVIPIGSHSFVMGTSTSPVLITA